MSLDGPEHFRLNLLHAGFAHRIRAVANRRFSTLETKPRFRCIGKGFSSVRK
jgi:hypothetical protein